MKTIYIIFLAFLALSCSESKHTFFDAPDSIHFRLYNFDKDIELEGDTIKYSFAFVSDDIKSKLLKIPIELAGYIKDFDRKYNIRVEEYGDTKNGVHFKKIIENQIFHAGKVRDTLKVLVNRTEDMLKSSFLLGIHIIEGDDLTTGLKEKLFVAIKVSDILEKPSWWDKWHTYFGDYNVIKFKKWIELWGGKGDLSGKYPGWGHSPKEVAAIFELRRYFENNPTYDNEGNLIVVPCPM